MPFKVVKHFKDIYVMTGNKELPHFDCINDDCDGQLYPVNPMDI